MSERSEPKQVCRRSALAFLGYAAAFGLVASSAVLTVSQAEAQTTTTPATPTTPPTDTREVWHGAASGTAKRASRTASGTTHGTRRAASGAAHRTRRATGRARRHHHPPSKKSNRFVRQLRQPGRLSAGREGRTTRRQRRAQDAGAGRTPAHRDLKQPGPRN